VIPARDYARSARVAIQQAVREDPSIAEGSQRRLAELFQEAQLNALRHALVLAQEAANTAPRLCQPGLLRLVDKLSDVALAVSEGRDVPDPVRDRQGRG